MSEHTEGPWQSEQAGPNTWIKAKDVTIAYIGGKDSIFTSHPGTPHRANARLIAAAPDLLKACKEMVTDFDLGEPSIKHSLKLMEAAIVAATD